MYHKSLHLISAIRNTVAVFLLLVSQTSCTETDYTETILVECIQGDTVKYEFNFRNNKVLPDSVESTVRFLSIPFPYSYGFTTALKSHDGDFLDCFVLDSVNIENRGDLISVKVRGVILMTDNGEEDCKLILASDNLDIGNDVNCIEQFLLNYSNDEIKIYDFVPISSNQELEEIVTEFQNSLKSHGDSTHYKKRDLFLGHAYGDPGIRDSRLDPIAIKTIKQKKYSNLILGGDYCQDINDKHEVNSILRLHEEFSIELVQGNHDSGSEILNSKAKNWSIEVDDNIYISIPILSTHRM